MFENFDENNTMTHKEEIEQESRKFTEIDVTTQEFIEVFSRTNK